MALFDYSDVFANSPMTGIADTFRFFKKSPNNISCLNRTFKNCKNLQHLPREDQPQQDGSPNWSWFFDQCTFVESMEETFAGSSITSFPLMKPLPYLYSAKGCFKDCTNLKILGVYSFLISARLEDLSYFAYNCSNITKATYPVMPGSAFTFSGLPPEKSVMQYTSLSILKNIEYAFKNGPEIISDNMTMLLTNLLNCEKVNEANIQCNAMGRIIAYSNSKFYAAAVSEANTHVLDLAGISSFIPTPISNLCRLARVRNYKNSTDDIYVIPADAQIDKDMLAVDLTKHIPDAVKLCEVNSSSSGDVTVNIADSLAPNAWPKDGTINSIYGYPIAIIANSTATIKQYDMYMNNSDYLCTFISVVVLRANL